MKKKLLLLLLLPVSGIVLILLGIAWSRDDLSIALNGRQTDGEIVAMVKVREFNSDMIVGLDLQLTFTRENGESIKVTLHNNQTTSVSVSDPASGLSQTFDSGSKLPADLYSRIRDVAEGDAETIKRLAQREARTTSGERIIRIEKLETARVYRVTHPLQRHFDSNGDSLGLPGMATVVTTRAIFAPPRTVGIGNDSSDWITRYEREVNGVASNPFRRDFILFDDPYTTEFRPVFRFRTDDRTVAELSNIGRYGGPSPTYRLFEPCRVAYLSDSPGSSILLPQYGSHDVGASPLVWFSFAAEGFFGRWVHLCLLAGTGIVLICMGLIVVSLAVKPSLRLRADPCDNWPTFQVSKLDPFQYLSPETVTQKDSSQHP